MANEAKSIALMSPHSALTTVIRRFSLRPQKLSYIQVLGCVVDPRYNCNVPTSALATFRLEDSAWLE
jgi:hypothetical protein